MTQDDGRDLADQRVCLAQREGRRSAPETRLPRLGALVG